MKRMIYVIKAVSILLVFFLGLGSALTPVMAKSGTSTSIKTVSLKLGNKNVTKKTYRMEKGVTEKLKVSVSPKSGKKTIKYTTSNQRVATVSSSGKVTAKRAGNARIEITVRAGKSKKMTWVKIKVVEPNPATENPAPDDPGQTPATDAAGNRKSIVIYFSCTDNTKRIAEYIKDSTDSDIYRIEAAVPYTSDDLNYNNPDSRTSREQNDAAARPEIAGEIPSLNGYDYVYIGYPIWWGQAPKIVYTFVERCNLTGKTVIPFCTSASSGIGTSATNLQSDTNQGTWREGKRFSGSAAKTEIESWISELGLS